MYIYRQKKRSIKENLEGITVFRIHIPKLKLFPRLSNMDYMYVQMAKLSSEIIRKVKPDIIHLLNFESIPLSAIYFKKKFNLPIVATVNTPMFGCFTGHGIDYKKETCIKCRVLKRYFCSVDKWGKIKGNFFYFYSLWYMNMVKYSYRSVDKFAVISNAVIPVLVNRGVKKNKIVVIHNPLGDPLRVNKNRLNILKHKYKNKKIIFCASRIGESKGIQYTLNALKYLPDSYVLLIAGWGDYSYELQKLAKKLKLTNRVIFLGKKPYEEIGTYYKLANVFSHFPTYYEAFGRTLIEAMSVGTPIVAYPKAGIVDIVDNNVNGILVKSYNSKAIAQQIQKVVEDKETYLRLSKNAKKTVEEKFSNKVIGKKYITCYDSVL